MHRAPWLDYDEMNVINEQQEDVHVPRYESVEDKDIDQATVRQNSLNMASPSSSFPPAIAPNRAMRLAHIYSELMTIHERLSVL